MTQEEYSDFLKRNQITLRPVDSRKVNFYTLQDNINYLANARELEVIEEFQQKGYNYEVCYSTIRGEKKTQGLYDLCGFASILFRDRRNSFYHQYRNFLDGRGIKADDSFVLLQATNRQEYSIHKARAEVVSLYLNTLGANTKVKSWID